MINSKKIAYSMMQEGGIGVILILICIIFSLVSPNFLTAVNISNIFTQISINIVLALGMTFVILLGGIDLGVGSVLALCTIIAGNVMLVENFSPGIAIFLAIISSVLVGMLCGFINGFVSQKWRIPAFIVTMGMLNIARGFALKLSDSRTLFGFPAVFNNLGTASFLQIPFIFWIAVILIAIADFVLRKTVYGRILYAIGNNEEAVRLSGHNVKSYIILAYVICGGAVGIAGIMYMMRLNIASPILGSGFELTAIAAAVIGGTSMTGGKGSMLGTLLGACILGVLNNGLLLIGLGDNDRQIITGIIIVAAVVLDSYRIRFIGIVNK
ncbi:MAG: ABC transporter permease [Spirochaetales bacterium]